MDILSYYKLNELHEHSLAKYSDLLDDNKIFHLVIKANREIRNEVYFEDVDEQILFKSWTEYKPIRGEFETCKLCQRGVMKNSTFFGRHLNKACEKNKEKLDLFQYFILHVLPNYESTTPTIEHVYGNPQDVAQDEITSSNHFGLANLFSEQNHASSPRHIIGFEIETTRIDESICESDVQTVSENMGPKESGNELTLISSSVPMDNSTDANILAKASKQSSNTSEPTGPSGKENSPNKSKDHIDRPDSSHCLTPSMNEYFNKCTYGCPICKAELKSENMFRKHVIHGHSVPEEKYKVDYPNPPPKTFNIWNCLKCGRPERHDATPIEKHVKETHKISLKYYFNSYCTN